jgi:hypothetical protein
MHVALLFPAATDPRSPHLSLASLAAALRRDGVRVTMRDLDVEGLHRTLAPERLQDAADTLRCRRHLTPEHERALAHADWLIEHITGEVGALQDEAAFLDPDRHHQARGAIDTALTLVSAASGRVQYTIRNADYAVDGVDATRLADLVEVTADPASNLFDDLYSDVIADLLCDRPDLVGISILNRQQVIPGLTLARRCHDEGLRVVLGGTVYAKFHDRLLGQPQFFEAFCDALVPYEGETALRGLVDAIDAGRRPNEWGDVPNVLSVDTSGRVVAGATYAEDTRALPTPDFEGLPLDAYLNPVPVLPILTGKGCYFNRCKFCDIPYINRIAKPYRMRDPEQIARDVATLHERHGARHFEITDETLSPNLLQRVADALDDHPGIEPRFVGYARFERGFTREACQRIHEMGVRKLFFGLESGNQTMLDHMDKGIEVEVARRVLADVTAAGIGVHVFSIVGFPEETEAQARDTLAFLLDESPNLGHPRNSFDIHPFGLDLRTEYGDHPERYGIELLAGDDGHTTPAEFPITLRGWRNTRGLSESDAAVLLDEFTAALNVHYRGARLYPDEQWPGYEEYAVVYGDHYDDMPFEWRLTLPDDGDAATFGLRWSDHVRIERVESGYAVRTFDGEVGVSEAALRLLGSARPVAPVDDHLDELVGGLAGSEDSEVRARQRLDVRMIVDELLAIRALWLRPPGSPA